MCKRLLKIYALLFPVMDFFFTLKRSYIWKATCKFTKQKTLLSVIECALCQPVFFSILCIFFISLTSFHMLDSTTFLSLYQASFVCLSQHKNLKCSNRQLHGVVAYKQRDSYKMLAGLFYQSVVQATPLHPPCLGPESERQLRSYFQLSLQMSATQPTPRSENRFGDTIVFFYLY